MRTSNFKQYLAEQNLSEASINQHFCNLNYFLNYCDDEDIEAEQSNARDLLGYVGYLKSKSVKQRTIQIYINSLTHYFNWLIRRGERQDNPARNIEMKGVKRQFLYDILSVQELEEIYQNFEAKKPQTNRNWAITSYLTQQRNKQMVGMMVYQGLTVAELNRLKTEDVRVREGKVYIAGSRKTNARVLDLQAHQIIDLLEYSLQTREQLLELTGKEANSFFVSAGSSGTIKNAHYKLMKKLKEQNKKVKSARQIRASVITKWLKNYNLRQVQYMAGHRYVSSTEKYLVNDWEQLKDEVEKYHPLK